MDKFAVLIPVYNEENNVERLADELDKLEVPYVFIDNGSKDKTATNLWLKEIPAVCIYPRRNKSFIIQLGARTFSQEGYDWILLVNQIKNPLTEDIQRLDNALFWHEEEYKIFITESGLRLIHKSIFEQIKSRWFDAELNLKIKWLKWKVIKV
jgi:glycosyltransferase involved in cell wall biosynthesis